MSYSLNSLKGVIWGIIWRTTIGVIKGDTRSLDYSSYGFWGQLLSWAVSLYQCLHFTPPVCSESLRG